MSSTRRSTRHRYKVTCRLCFDYPMFTKTQVCLSIFLKQTRIKAFATARGVAISPLNAVAGL